MFAVIYRGFVKPHLEAEYVAHWKIVAAYFVKELGALGSTLHQTEEGMWVAYSKWPSRSARKTAWPKEGEPNAALPPPIRAAISGLKQCLEEQLPEIEMEVVAEVLP